MKKKLLTILICVFLACFSSFVLTACSKSTEGLEYSINYDGKTVSVTSVGSVIEKKIVIPSKYNDFEVVAISEDAFNDCRFITDVTIPNTVTKIGANAFKNCINLTNITIPNSVTSIGGWAFYNCDDLTSITIPNSVTRIGGGAFADCNGLTSIYVNASTPPMIENREWIGCEDATLYVPKGSLAAYKATSGWRNFEEIKEF